MRKLFATVLNAFFQPNLLTKVLGLFLFPDYPVPCILRQVIDAFDSPSAIIFF